MLSPPRTTMGSMTSWATCGSGQHHHTRPLSRTCVSSGGHRGSTQLTALPITGPGSPPGWATLQIQPQTTSVSAVLQTQAGCQGSCKQPGVSLTGQVLLTQGQTCKQLEQRALKGHLLSILKSILSLSPWMIQEADIVSSRQNFPCSVFSANCCGRRMLSWWPHLWFCVPLKKETSFHCVTGRRVTI
uniref:Uncharacterized protein n=1 Tax=Macaca fascicularis TaxID=9541 RepID=A0A2K5VQN6_MACFA